jgi:SNF2 family DNA or RNA helicase
LFDHISCCFAGTPIQNDLSEFYAVFTLACPGLLGSLAEFRKTYEIPIQNGRDAGATDKQVEPTNSFGIARACAAVCGSLKFVAAVPAA